MRKEFSKELTQVLVAAGVLKDDSYTLRPFGGDFTQVFRGEFAPSDLEWHTATRTSDGVTVEMLQSSASVFHPVITKLIGGEGDYLVRDINGKVEVITCEDAEEGYYCGGLGLTSTEHPLVPKEWHGLGYKPLTREEIRAYEPPFLVRGVERGVAVEGVCTSVFDGSTIFHCAVGAPELEAVKIAVEDQCWPKDAVFAIKEVRW